MAGLKAYIKGLVFEAGVQRLVEKAGFIKDPSFKQYTYNKAKLHGRGATHQIDLSGVFRLGIPFLNPLFLIGEAKNYKGKVGKAQISQFLGTITDVTQYNRVNTRTGWRNRYKALLTQRVTYCPVFFSRQGFALQAEGMMFAHGINYISYENSPIMDKLSASLESVAETIDLKNFDKRQLKYFKNLDDLSKASQYNINEPFRSASKKYIDYVASLESYIGVLDRYYTIHVLSTSTIKPESGVVSLKMENANFQITQNETAIGDFSLTEKFIENYIKNGLRADIKDKLFKQLDLVLKANDTINLIQLIIDEKSREAILKTFESAEKQDSK